MKKEQLLRLGEKGLSIEIEIAKNIIINKINGNNKLNALKEEYEKNYVTTSEFVKKWFEYRYDFNDLDGSNLFARLLLNSKKYIDLCLPENQKINEEIRFNIDYYVSSELLNTFQWYFETQNYDIHNSSYIAQSIFEICGNITAFRNHFFSSNSFAVKISDTDLEIPVNAMYIFSILKMSLIHYIIFISCCSLKQNKDDVVILLTNALLSIINISKIYKIEDLIIETIHEIMGSSNLFVKLEKHMSNSSHNDNNILELSLNHAIELSKEYFSENQVSKL